MNILILSRFTPEVLKWSSHSYYYVLIYILADYWTRTNQASFVYSRHFNTPVTWTFYQHIEGRVPLPLSLEQKLNLSGIKFSFLQHSVVCFTNLPCLYFTSFHSTLVYPYLIFSNIFLCFLCIPFQL